MTLLPEFVHSAAAALAVEPVEPVDWSDPVEQAAWHRRVGHARAIAMLVDGHPGRAYAEVMRTYLRQVRVLGYGYAGIPGRPYDELGELP